MKLNKKKILALSVSSMLTAGLIAGNVDYATHTYRYSAKAYAPYTANIVKNETEKTKSSDSNISKEETVYTNLDANGKVKKVTVSDWLKNSGINNAVKDVSNLKDIKNTKGNEKFNQDGKNLTWTAGKDDIYYQGTTDEQLPVGVDITYQLDGQTVSAKDLIGKSGKLTMKITYRNDTTDYVPFVLATGMVLPVDTFQNITVDNGTVTSEGENQILVGYGVPGLKENLDLDSLDFGDTDINLDDIKDKMTDSITITADVKKFELGPTYTVATSDFFKDLDVDDVKDLDDLENKMDDLTEATAKLIDGTDDLSEGMDSLVTNFKTYSNGVSDLNDGAKDLKNGASTLSAGVSKYTSGTDTLLKGVTTYTKGVDSLGKSVNDYADGVNKLVAATGAFYDGTKDFPSQYAKFSTGLNTFLNNVTTQLSEQKLKEYQKGTSQLVSGVQQLNAGATQISSGIDQINGTMKKLEATEQTNAMVNGLKQMKAGYEKALANPELDATTKATYQAQIQAVTGAITYIEGATQAASAIDASTDGEGSNDLKAGVQQIVKNTDSKNGALATGVGTLNTTISSLAASTSELANGAKQLQAGDASIKSGIDAVASNSKEIYQAGLKITSNNKALKGGVSELKTNSKKIRTNSKKITANSKTLAKGSTSLFKGSKKLYNGTQKLNSNSSKLLDGMDQLQKGADKLNTGMNDFNKKGIASLTDTVNSMVDSGRTLQSRVDRLGTAAKNYKSFSGNSDSMDGSVKFVFATSELKSED